MPRAAAGGFYEAKLLLGKWRMGSPADISAVTPARCPAFWFPVELSRRRPGDDLDFVWIDAVAADNVILHPLCPDNDCMSKMAGGGINRLAQANSVWCEELRVMQMLQVVWIVNGWQGAEHVTLGREVHNLASKALKKPI